MWIVFCVGIGLDQLMAEFVTVWPCVNDCRIESLR